jgi:hypothetical protein
MAIIKMEFEDEPWRKPQSVLCICTEEQLTQLKQASVMGGGWPMEINKLMAEIQKNELVPDLTIVTVADRYGAFEGDNQIWGC